ncbi:LacI family DNA-binding transcriptional regulator [Clostridium boliviensis]|uniref:LacI family DNA-binding transcriptional regulator n=1 Tax=Clostridium boliviensis TaxID=318465 RepID=A0ABU4GT60_9CLOT|nr:LacI family DNA-binding transcriptional regulator [Clostridium boliviensis]MDW2800764.1 LacI family DNA-binding transcriptional regulator [Clostridium boliviensis]
MVTLKEIAKRCDVSVSTVSNILNGIPKVSEETKKRVLQVIKETGYQPNYIAQGLRKKKTKLIGIIAEDISLFSTPIIIESIMSYCESKNYRTIMVNLRLYARWNEQWYQDEEEYNSVLNPALQELLSIQVDGIIYVPGHARNMRCFHKDLEIPAVMTYGYTHTPLFPSVVIDDEKGGYDMTEYLLNMGHTRIGIIGGRKDNIHMDKRLTGYQRALYDRQIFYNPDLVCYGNWDRECGYEGAKSLLKKNVTAIFCFCDIIAGGVYDYLEENGLEAPEDISVVGFDDQIIAEYFRPSLTTAALPLKEIGKKAAELLIQSLDQEGEEKEPGINEIAVPCTLIFRKSVRKLL